MRNILAPLMLFATALVPDIAEAKPDRGWNLKQPLLSSESFDLIGTGTKIDGEDVMDQLRLTRERITGDKISLTGQCGPGRKPLPYLAKYPLQPGKPPIAAATVTENSDGTFTVDATMPSPDTSSEGDSPRSLAIVVCQQVKGSLNFFLTAGIPRDLRDTGKPRAARGAGVSPPPDKKPDDKRAAKHPGWSVGVGGGVIGRATVDSAEIGMPSGFTTGGAVAAALTWESAKRVGVSVGAEFDGFPNHPQVIELTDAQGNVVLKPRIDRPTYCGYGNLALVIRITDWLRGLVIGALGGCGQPEHFVETVDPSGKATNFVLPYHHYMSGSAGFSLQASSRVRGVSLGSYGTLKAGGNNDPSSKVYVDGSGGVYIGF